MLEDIFIGLLTFVMGAIATAFFSEFLSRNLKNRWVRIIMIIVCMVCLLLLVYIYVNKYSEKKKIDADTSISLARLKPKDNTAQGEFNFQIIVGQSTFTNTRNESGYESEFTIFTVDDNTFLKVTLDDKGHLSYYGKLFFNKEMDCGAVIIGTEIKHYGDCVFSEKLVTPDEVVIMGVDRSLLLSVKLLKPNTIKFSGIFYSKYCNNPLIIGDDKITFPNGGILKEYKSTDSRNGIYYSCHK